VLRLDRLARRLGVVDVLRLEAGGREHVGRVDGRPAVRGADRRTRQRAVVLARARRLARAVLRLRHPPAGVPVGAVDLGDGLQQPGALFLGHAGQHAAVGGDPLEQLGGLAQTRAQRQIALRGGRGAGGRHPY